MVRDQANESDTRALAVLSAALRSTGRATRRRAVAMLAHVECENRISWLQASLTDADEAVRTTALAVLAWVLPEAAVTPWPSREMCDRVDPGMAPWVAGHTESGSARRGWEYAVEVWRDDGLLVGVYAVTICEEDDSHARAIALGQAILANAGRHGDEFDSATAAMFIVEKCHHEEGPATREPPPPGPCDGRQA